MQKNLELLGPITYTEEENTFAKKIQEVSEVPQLGLDGKINPIRETDENPSGGSSDVGDVSWIVPEIRLRVTTGAVGAPWHSWAEVACAGMSIGHKGMLFAAKAMAMTMVSHATAVRRPSAREVNTACSTPSMPPVAEARQWFG